MRRLMTVCALLVLFVVVPAAVHAQATRSLSVMLYPYIPDVNNDGFAALRQRIESEFEALNPQIDLTVIMDVTNNTYSTSNLETYFTDPNGPQVIELDLMMLDYIVTNGWAAPVNYYSSDTFPVATNASIDDRMLWAIPTRVCSLFLFSYIPEVASATTSYELVDWLNHFDPTNQYQNLIGGFYGQNTLSIFYSDFYIGAHGPDSIYGPGPFYYPPDPAVVYDMSVMFEECTFNGENLCLTEVYEDESVAPAKFASGQILSYIGFSEGLYYVLDNNPVTTQIFIGAAPLGRSLVPMIYSDGLTLNKQNCDAQCQQDAYTFANYYLSSNTQYWITMSQDSTSPNPVPRYVLPAQPSFYNLPSIAMNPYFDEFLPAIENGYAFPTKGFTEARDPLFKSVCQYLDYMMPDDPCTPPTDGKS